MNRHESIERLIETAIDEDIGQGDITTLACIPAHVQANGTLLLKQAGVIAGLPYFIRVFEKIDPSVKLTMLVPEGSFQKAGTSLLTIQGPFRSILFGERTALNLIQHASGIATRTAAFIKKVAKSDCMILDTRKTLPGLRALEKYAVKIAGGQNHRFGLDDRFIIKRKHLAYLTLYSSNPIKEAVELAENFKADASIEVEIENQSQLDDVLKTNARAIMLCHMTPEQVKSSVDKVRKTDKKVYVDSSGMITLDTIRKYAETGVDGISIGDLTHSIQSLDMRLRLKLQE